MFAGVYPNIVKEFEASQLEKKTKKQGSLSDIFEWRLHLDNYLDNK